MKLHGFEPLLALLLLFFGVRNICCATAPINSTDVLALLEFKQGITNSAEALSNWNTSTNICQWKGVTCNPKNRGRVTALNLAGQGLSGAIAASVGNLTLLHTLNLTSNQLSGQIPPLNNLNKLQILDLSTNSLQGNIPDSITNCTRLRTIRLSLNSLVGTIPPNIGQLSNLSRLSLAVNNLTGTIPPSIQNITSLTALNLGSNQLSGTIPDLGGLGNLTQLLLGNNLLDGVIPHALTNCSNLTSLGLSLNKLTGAIPPRMGSLTKLQQLSLQRNGLSGTIPTGLGNITDLWLINFSENQLNGTIPDEFWQMAKIQQLDLSSNHLSGGIPHALSNLSFLQKLSLANNSLGNTLPSNIGDALPSLTTLYLGGNMFEGPIPASLGNALSLTQLGLSYNKLTGQIPNIFGRLSGLSYLDLDNNRLEASVSAGWEFFQGLTNCRSLGFISLSNNHLQGFIPNSIGHLSTNLTDLLMGGNGLSGIVPSSIGNLTSLIQLTLDSNNLTGTIEWIGKLTKLQRLNLQGNSFTGTIPHSISNLAQLIFLSFGENKFTGLIPPSLGNQLQHILTLNLSYNNFQGSIPIEVGNLRDLNTLDLSSNNLSGVIPETLVQCQQLNTIKMGQNNLTGNISTTLCNLYTLSILNVSHNNLSGPLPSCLGNLNLHELDLSYNNFQGDIPSNGVFDNTTVVSLNGNPGLCGGDMDFGMRSCHPSSKRTRTVNYLVKILIPIFGFLSLVLLVYFLLAVKKTSRRAHLPEVSLGENFEKVTYNDLTQATSDFSEVNLIGRGSYGSVYRGKLKENKMEVAVKVFDLQMPGAERSFLSECQALRSIQHRNLLPILTACSTVDNVGNVFKALIYEFMPNGSLDTWLHHKGDEEAMKKLSLTQRVDIVVNIADALDYLHHDCGRPTVHCDLKPSNILLDDDMNALLGDFGIARLYVDPQSTRAGSVSSIGVKGTIGYIPPEYGGGGQVSTFGDVYSFGIVLLEILTNKRPTDPMFTDGLDIISFVENNFPDQIFNVIDAHLMEECKNLTQEKKVPELEIYQCLVDLLQVALSCTRSLPSERSNMKQVASKIHAIKTSQLGWKYK